MEGFHKLAIDNKKIILKERLEKLFEITDILEIELFDIKKIKSLVPKIVKLRNHFIHSNNEFQMGQKLAYNILAFNYLLELIYLLNLLKFLGLNDNDLQSLLTVHIKGYHLQNTKKTIQPNLSMSILQWKIKIPKTVRNTHLTAF